MAPLIRDRFSAELSQAFANSYNTVDHSCLSFSIMDGNGSSLTADSPVPETVSTNHTPNSSLRSRSTSSVTSSTTSVYQAHSRKSIQLANQTDTNDSFIPPTAFLFDRPESAARSFLGKGRRALKHHGSKLSLSSLSSLDEPRGPRPRFLTLQGGHRGFPSRSKDSPAHQFTPTISAPFAFKHLTHTQKTQVKGLELVSQNELISEFSALRAGQRATTELKGIKAQDLAASIPTSTRESVSGPESVEDSGSASSTTNEALRSVAQSSDRLRSASGPAAAVTTTDMQPSTSSSDCNSIASEIAVRLPSPTTPSSSQGTAGRLHFSQSVENFSRPRSRLMIPTAALPRRVSSMNRCHPTQRSPSHRVGGIDATISPHKSLKIRRAPQSAPASPMRPGHRDEACNLGAVGCAITTADESARPLKITPLPMPPTLGDVPEDEECCGLNHRCQPHQRSPGNLRLRHTQSFPARDLPAISQTSFTSPTSPTQDSHAPIPSVDLNTPPPSMSGNNHWEDDVDYCYQHAAEADSSFDWTQVPPPPLIPNSRTASTYTYSTVDSSKHASHESSILSIASSIDRISRSTNSFNSLPELGYSGNSSSESVDWDADRLPTTPQKHGRTLAPSLIEEILPLSPVDATVAVTLPVSPQKHRATPPSPSPRRHPVPPRRPHKPSTSLSRPRKSSVTSTYSLFPPAVASPITPPFSP